MIMITIMVRIMITNTIMVTKRIDGIFSSFLTQTKPDHKSKTNLQFNIYF